MHRHAADQLKEMIDLRPLVQIFQWTAQTKTNPHISNKYEDREDATRQVEVTPPMARRNQP